MITIDIVIEYEVQVENSKPESGVTTWSFSYDGTALSYMNAIRDAKAMITSVVGSGPRHQKDVHFSRFQILKEIEQQQ